MSKKKKQDKNNSKKNAAAVIDNIFRPQTYKEQPRNYYLRYLPLVFLLGLVPILVHTVTHKTYLENFDWFSFRNYEMVDVFLMVKNRGVMIVGGIILLVMMYWLIKDRGMYETAFGKKNVSRGTRIAFCLLGAMAVLSLLSAMFSKTPQIAFFGTFESTEPLPVLLSCFLVAVYTYILVVNSDSIYRDISWTAGLAMFGYIILTAIAFFQTFGKDFFKTDMGKTVISSPKYWEDLSVITFSGGGEYATLHNVDYTPGFLGMIVPVIAALFLMAKTSWQKFRRGTLLLISIYCLVRSGADMGRVAFVGAVLIVLFIIAKDNKNHLGIYGGIVVTATLICLLVPSVRGWLVNSIVPSYGEEGDSENNYGLTKVITKKDEAEFTIDGVTYHFSYKFADADGIQNKLLISLVRDDGFEPKYEYFPATEEEGQHYEFTSMRHNGLKISEAVYYDMSVVDINRKASKSTYITFVNNLDDTGYYFFNSVGKPVKVDENSMKIPQADLFPNNLFGRGLIWNRTIPLLKNHMIIGSGAATFITEYPQDVLFNAKDYTSKPHSMYLQFWTEEGLLFLICFLLFFGVLIVQTICLILKGDKARKDRKSSNPKEYSTDEVFALAFLFAMIVFIINGIATDSMVVYSPVAWCFAGAGLGVNTRLKDVRSH